MTTANYLTSIVRLMDICESELLFDTLPIAKTQRDYIRHVWMKNSVVEEKNACICRGAEYYVNGKLHRIGGPASVHVYGEDWYINGKRHRTDGPADVYYNGGKEWFINGKRIK